MLLGRCCPRYLTCSCWCPFRPPSLYLPFIDDTTGVWDHADQSIGCLYVTHPDLYQRPLDSSRLRNLPITLDRRTETSPWPCASRLPRALPSWVVWPFRALRLPTLHSFVSQCPRDTVFVGSPQGDNEEDSTQSTPVRLVQHAESPLEAVFLTARPLAILPRTQLSLEDGTIMLERPLCVSTAGSSGSVTECNGQSIAGLPRGANSTFFNSLHDRQCRGMDSHTHRPLGLLLRQAF
jgi:hypothetical protein